MNEETIINLAVACVMASELDNPTKQEVIEFMRNLESNQDEAE